MNPRERFLRTCQNQTVDRPPVWIMRQAGRALPEYHLLRKKYSFYQLITHPELSAVVSLQPVRRFKLDACIVFTDILILCAAMGMNLKYGRRISLAPAIRSKSQLKKLKTPEVNQALGFVVQAIKNIRQELSEPTAVLGFSGAPFTLACYMIEGGTFKNFHQTKKLFFQEPKLFQELMEKISQLVADYLELQINGGADAVQIFDTWAGELAPQDYERFVLPHLVKIIQRLKAKHKPIIYYINGIGNLLELAKNTGAEVLGIDFRVKLSEVRKKLGKDQVVQGNLDPHLLFAPKAVIRKRVWEMINQTSGRGHIVNLGHGLIPETPLSKIATFVKAVKEWKK